MKDINSSDSLVEDSKQFQKFRNWLALLILLGLLGGGGLKAFDLAKALKTVERQVAQGQYENAIEGLQRFSKFSFWVLAFSGQDLRLYYLKISQKWIEAARYADALRVANLALQKFPNVAEFLLNKAAALVGLERFDEAKQTLEQALSLPEISKTEALHGVNYYLIVAQVYLGVRDFEKAKAYLDKAADKDSGKGDVSLLLARYFALQNDFKGMLEYYEKAFAQGSHSILWNDYFVLAVAHLNQKDITRFDQIFAKVKLDFPKAPGFHLLQALKFLQQENYATAYYQILFERETNFSGFTFFEDSIDALEEEFLKAFQRKPNEPWLQATYYFIRGKQAFEEGRLKEAERDVQRSLEFRSVHPLQNLYMARILRAQNRENEAIPYFGRVLDKFTSLSLARAELAELYLNREDVEAARHLWQQALNDDPSVKSYLDLTERFNEVGVAEILSHAVIPTIALDKSFQLQMNQMLIQQVGQMLAKV